MLKRDIQGKFALKNDDYREVRSLRLTDDTWKAIGIVSECLGLTRADYLEHIVRYDALPNITREDPKFLAPTPPKNESLPSITRQSKTSDPISVAACKHKYFGLQTRHFLAQIICN